MDYINAADYEVFRRKVTALTGIDLGLYKSQQMQRRIRSLLDKVGAPTFAHYGSLLERDPEELKRFCDYIMINVSEFFRNPEKFDELEREILPSLLRKSPNLSIWSAGASNGAEIYSVAMILDAIAPRGYHKLLATDIDSGAIAQALAGMYGPQDVKNVSRARMAKYFTSEASNHAISSKIKSKVQFKMHNLLADRFERGFDLILCRNVFIYFKPETQDYFLQCFSGALKAGGYLVIGSAEYISNPEKYQLKKSFNTIYQKIIG
jgi:chemotaxis protein methyltransferase CheR